MKNKGEILASVLKDFTNCYFFLHNTKELGIVKKIITYGFIFESQLLQSTDRVNPSQPVEITYFLLERRDYGPYTIVIAIPRKTFENYSAISLKNDVSLEEVISVTEPYQGENDEPIYTLSPKHILGYFDISKGDFINNNMWDPLFDNCGHETS